MSVSYCLAVEVSEVAPIRAEKSFVLNCSCTTTSQRYEWKTQREASEFWALCEAFSHQNHPWECPVKTSEDISASSLQVFLNEYIEQCGERVWSEEALLVILDDKPEQSTITKLRLEQLEKKVEQLAHKATRLESHTTDGKGHDSTEMEINYLREQLLDFEYKTTVLFEMILSNNRVVMEPPQDPASEASSRLLTAENLEEFMQSLRRDHRSDNQPVPASRKGSRALLRLSVISGVTTGSARSAGAEAGATHAHDPANIEERFSFVSNDEDTVNSPSSGSNFSPKFPRSLPFSEDPRGEEATIGTILTPIKEDDERKLSEATVALPDYSLLCPELQPSGPALPFIHAAIGEVLYAVQPHAEQLQYRSSVVSTIRRQARRALSSNIFEIGLHGLHCFLPDDPIRLTIALSKSRLNDWQKAFMEQVTVFSATGHVYDEEHDTDCLDDFKPLIQHAVSNLCFSPHGADFKVLMNIDALDVEVTSNSRADLCMLAFFEEVAQLVDREQLFKRSLQLIRGWWCYETGSYVGSMIKSIIPDHAFCLMVVMIFNLYHATISSPVEALYLFLSEFSRFDGANQAVTLQGIVNFKSQASNQPFLVGAKPHHLISEQIIEKYWLAFNVSKVTNTDPLTNEPVHIGSVSSSADEVPVNCTIIANSHDLSDSPELAASERSPTRTFKAHTEPNVNTVQYFDRFGFSVVHPFTHVNMLPEKVSNRKLARISKAFHIGFTNLQATLKLAAEDLHAASAMIKNFFPALLSRFGDYWRPDALGNQVYLDFDSQEE